MNPTDFETRARGAADKYFGVKYIGLNPQGQPRYEADRPGVLTWNASQRPVFLAGAQWSRTETIAEILGMLMSISRDAAFHLERQLKEGK